MTTTKADHLTRAPHGLGRRVAALVRTPWALPLLVFGVLAALLYGEPVFNLGWYYDDWALAATMQDAASSSWGSLFDACRQFEPAGRPGGCVYHATVYFFLGDHIKGYHLLSIVYLVGSSLLFFALLVRLRVPRTIALLMGALYIVYPGSDATRLWPASIGAQFDLSLYLAGVLLAIKGIDLHGRRSGLACHAASVVLFVALAFTYEAVLPLIALNGLLYVVAAPGMRRQAVRRGAVDLVLAVAFIAYRMFIDPVKESSGFVTDRTAGQTVDRVWTIVKGAWQSWHSLFLPWPAAVVLAVIALAVVAASAGRSRATRRRVGYWLAVGVGGAVFALAAVSAFTTANDLYVPQTGGTFNRLNFASVLGYCVLFGALAALLWEALRTWVPPRVAAGIVAALIVPVVISQVDTERDSQAAWADSWRAQGQTLAALRQVAPSLDRNASVVSFGHPIWERGFVPIFAAGWDLRGALDHETRVDPPQAAPFVLGSTCARQAVDVGGASIGYRVSSPLWFVNAKTREARRITSQAQCQAAVAAWGQPPFFDPNPGGLY